MNKIKIFQSEHGITADGIIGKTTMSAMMKAWGINKEQLSHFLGEVHHETGGFKRGIEDWDYRPERLRQVFPKYFPTIAIANKYAGREEASANRAYANRMGNGDEQSGDGWRYRGGGSIQLTGKANYMLFYDWLVKKGLWRSGQLPISPELVDSCYYWEAGLFYFTVNGLWKQSLMVNDPTIKAVTKRINGGYNGLADRIAKTKYYYSL